MQVTKTWAHIFFKKGKVSIEVMMNYKTKSYTLMSANEDQLISIKSETDESFVNSLNKSKCIAAALKYIQKELNL